MALTISQALRAFEIFRPKPDRAATDSDAAPATVEVVYDVLKAAVERLKDEVTAVKHELLAARTDGHKALDQILELHAAHKWLTKTQAEKLPPILRQGETVEAEAVLAAQQRAMVRKSAAGGHVYFPVE